MNQAQKLYGHIIRSNRHDLLKAVTFRKYDRPKYPKKFRVGRPRLKWATVTGRSIWNKYRGLLALHGVPYDPTRKAHARHIRNLAEKRRFF
eukprot:6050644-Karenia_brevis.AAC.1